MQSEISWQKQGAFTDIVYEKADGIARVTINRPSRRNAFTPETIAEMLKAFSDARDDASIGVPLDVTRHIQLVRLPGQHSTGELYLSHLRRAAAGPAAAKLTPRPAWQARMP